MILPKLIESGLCFLDHRPDFTQIVECHRRCCPIADPCTHDYSGAAASLPKDADLQVAESFVSRFKPHQLCCGFIDAGEAIDCVEQRIELVVIDERAILVWPLAPFAQYDHDSFYAS